VPERKIKSRRMETGNGESSFRNGDRNRCSNYGGSSFLNSGHKICSKIITNRFKIISETLLLEEKMDLEREGHV
jgi:hypothetical protein